MRPLPEPVCFDAYAADYDTALEQGLAVSGESKDFFARGRVAWLARCLKHLKFVPRVVLDFGCGTGTSVPLFFELLGAKRVLGVDVSRACLEVARRRHGSGRARFVPCDAYQPDGRVDLVFCNGVFHHIPPAERPATVAMLFNALRPGGLFALWENNPFNPGTRWVMSRIPFDRDAITLTAGESRQLLRGAGFEVQRTDYQFIFPRLLKALRFVEPWLARLPLGAQYQVLANRG
jgi:SAM-dependent methyltransferase